MRKGRRNSPEMRVASISVVRASATGGRALMLNRRHLEAACLLLPNLLGTTSNQGKRSVQ